MAEQLPRNVLDPALERWRQANILTEAQVDAIRDLEGVPAPGRLASPAQITPTTILIYIGVFLVLVASIVFVALGWNDMGKTEQMMWGTLAVAMPWIGGTFLRRSGQPLAEHGSDVLMAVGSLALIMFTYTFANLVGWWPERSTRQANLDREQEILLIGQVASVAASAWFAFRFQAAWMLAISGLVGWLAWSQAIERFWRDDRATDTDLWKMALYGVALIVFGLIIDRLAWRQHAFVLLFVGLVVAFLFLGIDAYDDALGPTGLLFLAMAFVAIVLSAFTEFRVFLIFGALGLYGWLSALVVETFGGSRPVAFGLILLGALIVALGLLWQSRLGDWVHHRRDRNSSHGAHAA
jgi:hypothetical protein